MALGNSGEFCFSYFVVILPWNWEVLQYNTIRGLFSAQPTTKMLRLGITMLINDKSQLKQNVEQIGFQLALKTNESFGYCLACLQNTSMYNDETL